MIRRLPFSLVALPALWAVLWVGGCVSSSNPAGPTDDSGPPPQGGDAGLDATVPSDAPAQETSLPPDDAAASPVTVVVTNDVGVEPGCVVLFHDATGVLTGTATTGADGTVTRALAPNSQVTVVFGTPVNLSLTTIQGVQPGDTISVIDTIDLVYRDQVLAIDAIPDASALSPGFVIPAVGGCGDFADFSPGEGPSIEYPCDFQGKFPVLLLVEDANKRELAYSYAKGNALVDDGGITHVSITRPLSAGETAQTVRAVNAPLADAGTVTLSYSEIAGGVSFSVSNGIASATTDDAGVQSVPFTGHPGYPDAVQSEVTLRNVGAGVATYRTSATRSDLPDGSTVAAPVDLAKALPEITATSVDLTDAGTSSRPVLSWVSAAPLASTDGLLVTGYFSVAEADDAGETSGVWTIIAPPTATSVRPPEIPASLGTWSTFGALTVLAVDATFFTGYGDLRQHVGALPPVLTTNTAIVPALPVDGTLNATLVTPAP